MTEFKQIIVVEGRDDTKRLRALVGDVDTIETGGSAISDATIAKIKLAQKTRGVIVLTDPDFQGQRIRNIIRAAVPDAAHAFLPRADAVPTKSGGSLGVEHAQRDALLAALHSVATPAADAPQQISQSDLSVAGLAGGLGAKRRREQLGDLLGIGYANGKQLLRRLQEFRISPEAFAQALQQINNEDKK
ncbi:ribonuclease M5 [Lacticaseibacillus pabuli]|uniref:Ribonuclease M5 n=1 Tax=Lacticaseibacillus pabuli TaxID=3025672 RepID=A0ABY7WQ14_9LACO|nr:ribonuclease M5 [Lacticaseibacillus sp. KACC 23028]WDF82287.1 ribonuclease M5 [Lacticaseibacillus sp. KACC 23028]